MNSDIKGVHVEITDRIRDHLNKKLQRLDFANEYIMDLLFSISQEKREYQIDVNINFRWGSAIHVGVSNYDIFEGIDNIVDKMGLKINKEKNKIQEHRGKNTLHIPEVE